MRSTCLATAMVAWGVLLTGVSYPSDKLRLGDIPEEPRSEKNIEEPGDSRIDPDVERKRRQTRIRKQAAIEVAEEWYQEGQKALASGQRKEALRFFERALWFNPKHPEAREKIQELGRGLQEPPVAKGTALRPSKSKIEKRELNTQITKGNWPRVRRLAQQLLDRDPDNADLQEKLSQADQKLFDEEVKIAEEKERGEDLKGAIGHYREALSFKTSQKISQHIQWLEKKQENRKRGKSDGLYLEALRSSQRGEWEKSYKLCEEALRLSPENLEARRMFERLKRRLGR